MSWHFSQALVEAYSEANSSGGLPSAPLSGKPTPQAYLSPDRMRAFSRLSRFGMTCEPLTEDLGADVLTWCLAASLAKTSAQPEKAPESMESDQECGRTWRESFARWDRATSSWRTPQCSLLEGLDVFSETWPQWGTMRAGECSEQSMPVLRTSETESGFWPTPRTTGLDGGSNSRKAAKARGMWPTPQARDYKGAPGAGCMARGGHQSSLPVAIKMWPTPSAQKTTASGELTNADGTSWDGESKPHSKKTGRPVQTALMDKVKMYPTPTCHMAKECDAPSEANRNEPSLTHQARGGDKTQPKHLNPVWVEWLMGWPLGWTDLKPLATDKFQSWRHSHGGF